MSLSTLIFRPEEFNQYYNCSSYDVDDIPVEQRKHFFEGLSFIVLGIMLEMCYVPCLYAMFSVRMRRQACYRLMFYMGIVEVLGIANNSFCGAWMLIEGAVFCTRPKLLYAICTFGIAIWVMESTVAIILSLNRCLTIYDLDLANRFFNGWRWTAFWLSIPTVAGFLFVWNTPPLIFNSISASAFFNPHIHYLPDQSYYHRPLHILYNCLVVAAMISIYVLFGILFRQKFRHVSIRQSKREISTFFQVLITCILAMITAIGYLIQQTFPDFKPLIMTSTYGYVLYQGSPAIIYLCMNPSIRNVILNGYNKIGGTSFYSHQTKHQTKQQSNIATISRK
ncbi:serpentine type 7TM GPCR chemoreceptor srt domain-containing protein [Ditylenchus destructor]|nr:serpentine type 7TM GPCR chemoreceptor srt domain-containing protein [Ditylenchus destructor]